MEGRCCPFSLNTLIWDFTLLPSYLLFPFKAEVINYKGDLNTPPDQVQFFRSEWNIFNLRPTRRRGRRRQTLWGRRWGWARAREEGTSPAMRTTGDLWFGELLSVIVESMPWDQPLMISLTTVHLLMSDPHCCITLHCGCSFLPSNMEPWCKVSQTRILTNRTGVAVKLQVPQSIISLHSFVHGLLSENSMIMCLIVRLLCEYNIS